MGLQDEGPCAANRRIADERCAEAARLRRAADAAQEAFLRARTAHEETAARLAGARAEIDPRAVRGAKDDAQRRFREARRAAASPLEAERAAAVWLDEINRINRLVREAAAVAREEEARVSQLAADAERLGRIAESARVTADAAAHSCQDAREALAECEEAETRALLRAARTDGEAAPEVERRRRSDRQEAPTRGLDGRRSGGERVIDRVLRGDRSALAEVAAALGAPDAEERRQYQLLLADLVDALVAEAARDGYLDFPTDDPFWGQFAPHDARQIAAALARMGYGVDSHGGVSGGRIPSVRDLSLAIGYAGLEPKRVRSWPGEERLADLYRGVTVAAHEYLAERAPDLTLGEMVTLLGRRSEALAELWNRWGRARPVLLSAAESVRPEEDASPDAPR